VALRFSAYGWQVLRVTDGNDLDAVAGAIAQARQELSRPSIIIVKTQIAYGSPNKQGTADAHGAPLGEDEVAKTKVFLGCAPDAEFCVVDPVSNHFHKGIERGAAAEKVWEKTYRAYVEQYPDMAASWQQAMAGELPKGWEKALPFFDPSDGPVATRAASGQVLNAIAGQVPLLMGGSADLAPSNKTFINGSPEYQKQSYHGRNIRFGVREHAMGAVLSGMALHGGIRPFGGTFLVFADYLRPSIRLAAMMRLPVIYVFTHDSIAVGEDGPTHQPVEHLASLRAIPGLKVIRPCDAGETVEAWRQAIVSADAPVALILSRQKLDVLDRRNLAPASGLSNGAYVIDDSDGTPALILVATGSEVHLALKAKAVLAGKGHSVRVVSMPSWELFEAMPDDYRKSVFPDEVQRRLVIEAGISMGWESYVGKDGRVISMEGFGASAPGGTVMEAFGFTVDNVVHTALSMLTA
jgi:transketolase